MTPFFSQVGEGELTPAGVPFAPPGQPNDATTQGLEPANQLNAVATSAASAAMPLGLDGWSGGQMPLMFGAADSGNAGSAPAAEQANIEQDNSAQAQQAVVREYTANGKRK